MLAFIFPTQLNTDTSQICFDSCLNKLIELLILLQYAHGPIAFAPTIDQIGQPLKSFEKTVATVCFQNLVDLVLESLHDLAGWKDRLSFETNPQKQ